ncbi:ATP-dependent helicase HrpB [Pseudidiomarina indica]|uniref:ATP-dependent helicase HrpB n=1 Tax=Pseudidiomarina indica TaxID=1159017 RepID=A0A1G6DG70_9GAMM|nr:ATP-dependent helicase HrpB [Pseudidiomarina indica]SDB44133.1 ATP-dependent helicase HrpB [Pseudidiomarina indica]
MATPQALPVTALIDDVLRLLPSAPVVLEAPPGAGKSTALPLALLHAPQFAERQIYLLQPRRIAALSIAQYLAEQLGEAVGETVGYHIRGEAKFSARTRLLILTEGMFTQYIQRDPELAQVGCVIFDEFHERHLATDLGLAMALECAGLRDDLALLVMSATLPADTIAAWLGTAHVLKTAGRQYPIEVHYRPPTATQSWLAAIPAVIQEAMQVAEHGVLVFVPGRREIEILSERFAGTPGWDVMPLHRQVPLATQRRALKLETQHQRRLVIATNIAETSMTIAGIDVVVDSGRERQALFYPQHGVTKLVTRRISLASATQRAGRAGRLRPGQCFKLWGKADEHGMRQYQPAEIETADLTGFLLECLRWGAPPSQLQFLTPPNSGYLEQAEQLLEQLGCYGVAGGLSSLGRQIAALGTDPRWATILIHAQQESPQHAATAAWLVAQLEYQVAPQHFPLAPRQLTEPMQRRYRHWRQQLGIQPQTEPNDALITSVLLWGCGDRIAQRRGATDRYLLSNGAGAMFHESDLRAREPWLLVLDMMLSEHHRDAVIQLAWSLSEADLEHPAVPREQQLQVRWHGPQQRLRAVAEERIGAIVVRERQHTDAIDDATRARALTRYLQEQLQQHGWQALQLPPFTQQWLARMALFEQVLAPADWPSFALPELIDQLADWAAPYWQHIDSLVQLQTWDPLTALQARLTYQQLQEFESACPTSYQVPSGRTLKIDYTHQPPIVAAKLQELFGTPVTPSVCAGKINLTLDLLSPAGRLLQRTADLASFWQTAYPAVQKEMKGRYPKHPWPDDPLQAEATIKVKRQRQ